MSGNGQGRRQQNVQRARGSRGHSRLKEMHYILDGSRPYGEQGGGAERGNSE